MANCGEQHIIAKTTDGTICNMTWQIVEGIRRPLLAVSSTTKNNNTVTLEEDGGWITNRNTGATTKIRMKNGVYVMSLWVQVFPGQVRK